MIFVPTRGRRKGLKRFFEQSKPRLPGRVVIDDDDDSYKGMTLPDGWAFIAGKRVGVVASVNRALAACPGEPFYASLNDDTIFSPEGWDEILAEACQPAAIAWGDDGKWGEGLCTTIFVGGELVRALGFLLAPCFGHLYADRVWWEIANAANIKHYFPDVKTTHHNEHDKTFRERKMAGDSRMFSTIYEDGTLKGWEAIARATAARFT